MGKQMDQDKLKALAAELAKDIKSEKDLGTLTQQLIKLTVETAGSMPRWTSIWAMRNTLHKAAGPATIAMAIPSSA